MTEPHTHGPAGEYVPVEQPAEDAAAVADAATEVAETTADADVKIAKINADLGRDLAAADLKREEMWQERRVAELEARVAAQQELIDRLAPPEPAAAEPVVIAPAAEPEPETAPAPPPAEDKGAGAEPEAEPKKKRGFWGSNYG